jgi:hypothetical protein
MTDIVERLLDAKIESYSDRLEAADTILRLRAALSELLDYSDSDYGKKTRIARTLWPIRTSPGAFSSAPKNERHCHVGGTNPLNNIAIRNLPFIALARALTW